MQGAGVDERGGVLTPVAGFTFQIFFHTIILTARAQAGRSSFLKIMLQFAICLSAADLTATK